MASELKAADTAACLRTQRSLQRSIAISPSRHLAISPSRHLAISMVEFALGVWMLRAWRTCGVWAGGAARAFKEKISPHHSRRV
jgi:hypothetical protein